MKKFAVACALFVALSAQASDVQLIVEKVENQAVVPGSTYRVWADLGAYSNLHIIWGDEQHPLHIESTAPFFQHELGTYSSAGVSDVGLMIDPSLAFDSYVTLGYDNEAGNDLWYLGMDFDGFNGGGAIHATNGAWFLIPTDEKCAPSTNGLVLIAQFTTTGTVTGTMNLQGWSEPQVAWREYGLTFTTTDAKNFGCTDATAANYDPAANYDDGSCEAGVAASVVNASKEEASWEVFPNPLRGDLIHVQFNGEFDFAATKARFDILDLSGRLVATHEVATEMITDGNRITLNQSLASGTYKVVLYQDAKAESKTIVVEH